MNSTRTDCYVCTQCGRQMYYAMCAYWKDAHGFTQRTDTYACTCGNSELKVTNLSMDKTFHEKGGEA